MDTHRPALSDQHRFHPLPAPTSRRSDRAPHDERGRAFGAGGLVPLRQIRPRPPRCCCATRRHATRPLRAPARVVIAERRTARARGRRAGHREPVHPADVVVRRRIPRRLRGRPAAFDSCRSRCRAAPNRWTYDVARQKRRSEHVFRPGRRPCISSRSREARQKAGDLSWPRCGLRPGCVICRCASASNRNAETFMDLDDPAASPSSPLAERHVRRLRKRGSSTCLATAATQAVRRTHGIRLDHHRGARQRRAPCRASSRSNRPKQLNALNDTR